MYIGTTAFKMKEQNRTEQNRTEQNNITITMYNNNNVRKIKT